MSSEYKIKGRQRSKPAKPYDRRTGIVNRVKEWLPALPSWLNWNTTADDSDRSGTNPTIATGSAPQRGLPSVTSFNHPKVSFPQSTYTEADSHHASLLQFKLLQNNTKHSSLNSSSDSGLNRRLFESTTMPLMKGGSELHIGGVTSRGNSVKGSSMEEDLDSSNESERSWVAEDTEEEAKTVNIQPRVSPRSRPLQLSGVGLSTPLSRTPLNVVVEGETTEYEIGEGTLEIAPESTLVVSSAVRSEHTVERLANPALFNVNSIRTPVNSIFSNRKVTPSTTSSLDRGLHSSNPLVTSTPQLSPVHEERIENIEQPESSGVVTHSQSQIVSDSNSSGRQIVSNNKSRHSVTPRTGSISLSASIQTPSAGPVSKFYTQESIKRSPFHSPFYSGRTSFGGAASRQTPRTKRPRTESSPPALAPVRLSITARSVVNSDPRGGHHQLVASSTAKRILTTLESLNSPLSDARKMPMRALPGEHQTSKRRRMSDIPTSSGAGILSPPPVTPLHTPVYPLRRPRSDNHTQIVPNEKTMRTPTKQSPLQELASLQAQKGSPKQSLSSSSRGSLPFTVPQFNTKEPPKQSSILAGLQFTPAPPSQPAGVQGSPEKSPSISPLKMTTTVSTTPGLTGFKPSFHGGTSPSGASGGGGKIRPSKRTHHHFHREPKEDTFVNPHAPPPSVGLSLGKDGSLPQFSFHTQLAKSKTPPQTTSTVISALSSMPHTLSTAAGYSFSLPKAIDSNSAIPFNSTHQQEATFDFSSPTTCAPLSFSLVPPNTTSSSLSSTSIFSQSQIKTNHRSNLVPFKSPPNAGTSGFVRRRIEQPLPPPLKNMSVEEALKKPEYQLPSLQPIPQIKSSTKSSPVCIDLTESSDDDLTQTQPKKQTTESSGSGGLQLEVGKIGSGLKLPSSGIQLGSKNSLLTSSAGPLKALPQFAPPSNSWTCDTCMISNKDEDDKCVACSTKKPGSAKVATPSTSSSTLSAPSIGLTGGLKLGGNLSVLKSNQSSKSDSITIQPLSKFAPPSGSWSCDTCMITNKAEDAKCAACSASKPDSANKTATCTSSATKASTSISLGATSGLKIDGALLSFKPAQASSKPDAQLLSKFAPPSGSWTCDTCMISNKAEDSKCVACSAAKPGSNDKSVASSATNMPPNVTIGTTGGLKLGGYLLEAKSAKQDALPLSKFAPPSGSWTCDTCMISNKAEDNKCVACSASKPGSSLPSSSVTQNQLTPSTTSVANSSQSLLKPLTQFAPPTGSWSCDVCMINNKAEDNSCAACSAPKPGAKTDSTNKNQGIKSTGGLSIDGGIKLGSGITLGGPLQSGKTSGGVTLGGGGLSLGGDFKLGASGASLTQSVASQNAAGGLKLGAFKGASEEKKTTTKLGTTASTTSSSGGIKIPFGLKQQTGENNAQTKPISFGIQQPVSQSANVTLNTAVSTQSGPSLQSIVSSSTTQVTQTTSSAVSFNFSASSSATSGFNLGNTSTCSSSSGGLGTLPTFNPPSGMQNPLTGSLQSSTVPNLGTPFSFGGQGLAPSTSSLTQTTLAGVTSSSNNQGFQFSVSLPPFGKTTTSSEMTTSSVLPSFNFSGGKQTDNGKSTGASSLFVFSGAKDSNSGSPFPTAGSASSGSMFGSGVGTAGSEQSKLNFGFNQQNATATSLFGSGEGQSSENKASSQPQGIALDQQRTGTLFGTSNLFGNQSQPQMQQQQQQTTTVPAFNFHASTGNSGAPFSGSGNSSSVFGNNGAAASGGGLGGSLSLPPQMKLSGSGLGGGPSLFGTNSGPSVFSGSNQTTSENTSSAVSSSSNPSGFVFNASGGLNLNFGGSGGSVESNNGAGGTPLFTAGSQSNTRIVKKARRRK